MHDVGSTTSWIILPAALLLLPVQTPRTAVRLLALVEVIEACFQRRCAESARR